MPGSSSESTHELISSDFVCQPRDRVTLEGKGAMEVWHVTGLVDRSAGITG